MGFGKRKVKKDDHADNENDKKSVDKSHSGNSSTDNINSVCNTLNNNVKQKTYGFMKKTRDKSSGLLFGQTKEEKLKLYIYNLKLLHPNMPKFWAKKEIDKFKKKFNI